MMRRDRSGIHLPAATLVLPVILILGACAENPLPPPAPPTTTSLTQTYRLVDPRGSTAGSVVMQPLGGGEIYDSTGKEIGKIVPP